MIPRTKHLVVTALSLMGVTVLGGIILLPQTSNALFGSFASPALLIESGITKPEVVIETSTLRDEMRKKLKDALGAYVRTSPRATEVTTASALVETEVRDTEAGTSDVLAQALILCVGITNESMTLPSWGPVRIAVGEGARVVRTNEENADGLPRRSIQLPLEPTVNDVPSCLPSGMTGVLVDGTVLTVNTAVTTMFEGLAGYAIDGFPIFAQFEDGRKVTNSDLDQCHGHVHEIVDQGVVRSVYHYHITEEAPYTLGCFMGTARPLE